jgi:hypothetical protein
LFRQVFGPENEPRSNPADLPFIAGVHNHIQSVPDQAGREFAKSSVLFVRHVFTAFINNIPLLMVRVPTFVTLASELATALACACSSSSSSASPPKCT